MNHLSEMNVENSIKRFINFCLVARDQTVNHGELLEELDLLLVNAKEGEFVFDENDYPEPPEKNYQDTREKISSNFPELGLYCTADGEPEKIEKAEVLMGDAIDDLTDIVCDLREVQWYFDNTTENNALWHLQMSFRSHWGLHARELQLHLHKYWW